MEPADRRRGERDLAVERDAKAVQAMREDRILREALATEADVRRLCDLFGITVGAAVRYAHTTGQSTSSRIGAILSSKID
jgi:hypothetical protein